MTLKGYLASAVLVCVLGAGLTTFASAAEGHPRAHGGNFIGGEVVSIDGDLMTISVVAEKEKIQERLADLGLESGDWVYVTVGDDTKVFTHPKPGQLGAFDDIQVGDKVFVAGELDGDNMEAKAVSNKLPKKKHVKAHKRGMVHRPAGKVLSIDTSTNEVTVEGKDGETRTFTYSDDTKFFEQKSEVSEDTVEEGDILAIHGKKPRGEKPGEIKVIHIVPQKN